MTLFKTIAFGILLVLSPLFSFAQLPYVVHPIPPGFPTSTFQKRSNDLQVDAGNNKWLAFASFGVGSYDGANWTTYSTTNSGLPSDSAICIDFDNSGNTWIGTKEGAVYKSGSNWTVYNSSNSGLPSNVITAIFCDGSTTWFGTKTGLASFDGANWTVFNTGNSGLENDSITTLAKSGTGDLWIGTRGGLAKYNAGSWTTYNPQNSILNRFIYDLECDNFGRTWVASGILIPYTNVTGIEISFIDNSGQVKSFKEELYQYDLELAYYTISCGLAKNLNGNIYFQTSLGICEVDNNDIEIYKLPVLNMGSAAYGNLMQLDNNGTIWLVTKLPFNFYSLDISGYVYPLGDVNFRNHRFLDINEVSAGINVAGDMHFNYSNAAYEVPKGSGKHSIFASALWIGGVDPGGQIHLAGQTYRQTGNDFWPGPIDGISVPFDSSTCIAFDRIWKIDKWKVEEFKNQFLSGNVTNGSYEVPDEIATWPAKGNGIVISQLAPFIDANGDGIYDAMNGDYPDIKGDQMLYRIFNDSLESHAETGGEKLGVEVHASAYSFYCPNIADSNQVLNRTTFYNYEIINRSAVDYDSVYMGLWTDADLGYAIDDLTGCDTLLAAGFVYNGDNLDDGTEGYGLNPPMQNIKILRGTQADPMDGLDNDLDGTIDESGERTTMNHFQYYVNANGTPSGNPGTPLEFYNYMKSIWTNGQHVTDPLGVPTNFMFSGVPYSGTGWTQSSTGLLDDIRFLMSSGPFSLDAGDTANLDFAYVFTWDSLSPNGLATSIARNQADLQRVQYWFDNNNFPSCQIYSVGIDESENHLSSLSVYPNPASEKLYVAIDAISLYGRTYTIYNLLGDEISIDKFLSNNINIAHLPPQVYLLKIDFDSGAEYAKFVKW